MSDFINGSMTILAGVYMILVSQNYIKFESIIWKKNWAEKQRKLFLIAGPFLVLFEIMIMLGFFNLSK